MGESPRPRPPPQQRLLSATPQLPTAAADPETTAGWAFDAARKLGACALWTVSLLALLTTNKLILPGLRYPLSVSAFHFLMCSWASVVVFDVFGAALSIAASISASHRGGHDDGDSARAKTSPPDVEEGGKRRAIMAHSAQRQCAAAGYRRMPLASEAHAWKVVLLAALIAASIAANNLAFETLALSYLEVVASATPAVTAAVAFCLQGRVESVWTYAALLPIAMGVVAASSFESSFNVTGFIAASVAVLLRALKGVMAAMLMAKSEERLDPASLLAHAAPVCVALLLPVALVLEPGFSASLAAKAAASHGSFLILFALNGCLAYAVNFSNNLVNFYTSPLTLQILGVLKSSVTVLISVFAFRAPLSSQGVLGYSACTAGVVLYFACKRRFPTATMDNPPCLPRAFLVSPSLATNCGSSACANDASGGVPLLGEDASLLAEHGASEPRTITSKKRRTDGDGRSLSEAERRAPAGDADQRAGAADSLRGGGLVGSRHVRPAVPRAPIDPAAVYAQKVGAWRVGLTLVAACRWGTVVAGAAAVAHAGLRALLGPTSTLF